MRKRKAKKILRSKERLNYSPKQLEAAEKKVGLKKKDQASEVK